MFLSCQDSYIKINITFVVQIYDCYFIMELPNDPMMLFSVINMKLRDNYSSLDKLCDDMHINKSSLINKLKDAGFEYSEEHNKFW